MIENIMNKIIELYTTFVGLPVEYQIITGVGGLFILAALRNVWGLIRPVRWVAGTSLRAVAFVIHPSGHKPRKKQEKKVGERPPFDVLTRKRYLETIKAYAGNAELCMHLTDHEIHTLRRAGEIWTSDEYSSELKHVFVELQNRCSLKKAGELMSELGEDQNRLTKGLKVAQDRSSD